jgi:O-antigen/teichoic acid export membrane protein
MTVIAKSASWTTISTIFGIAVQILQLAILSRTIETAIFGQYAILNLFIEIFTAVALGGISNYLMYKRELNQEEKNTIFTLAITIGLVAFVIVILLAYPILYLMRYTDLFSPLMVLSVLLVMHAVGAQYQTLGLLAFKHAIIAKIEIASRIMAFGIAIATIDLGLYCLIFSTLSYQLFRLIGIMVAMSHIANLGLNFKVKTAKDAFKYGVYDLGGQWLNITRKQIDTLILAAILPLQELGAYHLIKQLASRPAQAIQPIIGKMALPLFSHAKQNPEHFKSTYYDLFCVQAVILAICYAPLIGASDLITLVIYGEEFQKYAPILALLSLFWFIRVCPSNLMGPLVQVSGKTYLSFYWNIAILPVNALVMYLSALHGIYALTIALVIFQSICVPLAYYFVIKKVSTVDFNKTLIFLIIPLLCLIAPLFILEYIVIPQLELSLLLKVMLYVTVYSADVLSIFMLYSVFKQSLSRLKHYNMD